MQVAYISPHVISDVRVSLRYRISGVEINTVQNLQIDVFCEISQNVYFVVGET